MDDCCYISKVTVVLDQRRHTDLLIIFGSINGCSVDKHMLEPRRLITYIKLKYFNGKQLALVACNSHDLHVTGGGRSLTTYLVPNGTNIQVRPS